MSRRMSGCEQGIADYSICHSSSKSTISLISTSLLSQLTLHIRHNTSPASPRSSSHRALYDVSEVCLQCRHGGPHGWYVSIAADTAAQSHSPNCLLTASSHRHDNSFHCNPLLDLLGRPRLRSLPTTHPLQLRPPRSLLLHLRRLRSLPRL